MPDKNSKFWKKGFTLLEVLVAIGVMAIVTAVAVPNLRNFNKTQQVEGAASQLTNVLKNAQSSAASRILCPSGSPASNWNVVLTANNYAMNCAAPTNQQVYTSPYALAANSTTTFQMTNDRCAAGQTLTIFFSQFQNTYQCNATPTTLWPISITLSGGSSSKKVVVEQGGVIRNE